MQCFPVKSLVHKVLGGGGVYAYIRYFLLDQLSYVCFLSLLTCSYITSLDCDGRNVLGGAANARKLEVLKFCVDNFVAVSIRHLFAMLTHADDFGCTPLHFAASGSQACLTGGSADCIKFLVTAILNCVEGEDSSLNFAGAKLHLTEEQLEEIFNCLDTSGFSPLAVAVQNGWSDIVKFLLCTKHVRADLTVDGCSLLQLAKADDVTVREMITCYNDLDEQFSLVVKDDIVALKKVPYSTMIRHTRVGMPVYKFAAFLGRPDCLSWVMDMLTDDELCGIRKGEHATLLMVACASYRKHPLANNDQDVRLECVKIILKRMGHLSHGLNMQDAKGQTALHVAALSGYDAIVRCLLGMPFLKFLPDNDGRFAIDVASTDEVRKAFAEKMAPAKPAKALKRSGAGRGSTAPTAPPLGSDRLTLSALASAQEDLQALQESTAGMMQLNGALVQAEAVHWTQVRSLEMEERDLHFAMQVASGNILEVWLCEESAQDLLGRKRNACFLDGAVQASSADTVNTLDMMTSASPETSTSASASKPASAVFGLRLGADFRVLETKSSRRCVGSLRWLALVAQPVLLKSLPQSYFLSVVDGGGLLSHLPSCEFLFVELRDRDRDQGLQLDWGEWMHFASPAADNAEGLAYVRALDIIHCRGVSVQSGVVCPVLWYQCDERQVPVHETPEMFKGRMMSLTSDPEDFRLRRLEFAAVVIPHFDMTLQSLVDGPYAFSVDVWCVLALQMMHTLQVLGRKGVFFGGEALQPCNWKVVQALNDSKQWSMRLLLGDLGVCRFVAPVAPYDAPTSTSSAMGSRDPFVEVCARANGANGANGAKSDATASMAVYGFVYGCGGTSVGAAVRAVNDAFRLWGVASAVFVEAEGEDLSSAEACSEGFGSLWTRFVSLVPAGAVVLLFYSGTVVEGQSRTTALGPGKAAVQLDSLLDALKPDTTVCVFLDIVSDMGCDKKKSVSCAVPDCIGVAIVSCFYDYDTDTDAGAQSPFVSCLLKALATSDTVSDTVSGIVSGTVSEAEVTLEDIVRQVRVAVKAVDKGTRTRGVVVSDDGTLGSVCLRRCGADAGADADADADVALMLASEDVGQMGRFLQRVLSTSFSTPCQCTSVSGVCVCGEDLSIKLWQGLHAIVAAMTKSAELALRPTASDLWGMLGSLLFVDPNLSLLSERAFGEWLAQQRRFAFWELQNAVSFIMHSAGKLVHSAYLKKWVQSKS